MSAAGVRFRWGCFLASVVTPAFVAWGGGLAPCWILVASLAGLLGFCAGVMAVGPYGE
jgi:hypothetical protein